MIWAYEAEITAIVTVMAIARNTARWLCSPRVMNASSGP